MQLFFSKFAAQNTDMHSPDPEKTLIAHDMLQKAERIVIVSHHHPDGDAAGSSTALMHFINSNFGRKAQVILPTALPEALDFLLSEDVCAAEDDIAAAKAAIASCDLLICLDFNTFSRTDFLEESLRTCNARKILIDHHLKPDTDCFDLVFSKIETSSASELLYDILMLMPEIRGDASRLPAACATALMTGMTTDTNNFANSVFPGTLRMASALLEAGVDRDALVDRIFNCYRENRYRAMGWLTGENMRITANGVAYMILRETDSKRFGLREGDTEGFVNIPLGIKSVRMTIFLREDNGFFRVSVRSKRGISANRLARESFHGGGHEQAAGGRLYWPDDISSPDAAADYIEQVTARFMQNEQPSK